MKNKYKPTILIVEDDVTVISFLKDLFKEENHIITSQTGDELRELLNAHTVDLMFVDLHLPGKSGHDIMNEVRGFDPSIEMIVISSTTDINDAIRAFNFGISDFLPKPLIADSVRNAYSKCIERRSVFKQSRNLSELFIDFSKQLFIGETEAVKNLNKQVHKLIGTDIDVLIVGESGTGKELIAKTLHKQEQDTNRPYIPVNCSAIPHELIESILFGHEKGSFTGAVKKQLGKFELANGGDIFLDEIGTLPLYLQAKLLRVLQEREIEPIGLGTTKKLQFRVIAATNEDMPKLVGEKEFRKDLYFRINKMVLHIPPLRERKNDVPLLVKHFLKKHARNNQVKKVDDKAMKFLTNYNWPGNVRELENVIENLIITADGDTISLANLSHLNLEQDAYLINQQIMDNLEMDTSGALQIPVKPDFTLAAASKELERVFIRRILEDSSSKQEAASKLGIDRRTLYRKLQELGME